MHIIVPIKQVPETSNVKMDPKTGLMLRNSVEGVLNPLDLFAVEAALRLRESLKGTVSVISMGPKKADTVLRDALALGCDHAILLSDKRFSGSDTWATSYTLSLAIKRLAPFDLIICGERSIDGETGQVGPGIAAFLDLPVATYVSRVIKINKKHIHVERIVEEGRERIWSPLPMVLMVIREVGTPRLSTLRSKLQASKANIPIWGPDEIGAREEWLGLNGSPTRVVKVFSPKLARGGRVISAQNPADIDKAGEIFIQFLKDRDLTAFIPNCNIRI